MVYAYQAWPCWCTGPNGETQVFDREEDVQTGWTHHETVVGDKKKAGPSGDVADLRKAFQERFGKKPFMGWGADELRKRLDP